MCAHKLLWWCAFTIMLVAPAWVEAKDLTLRCRTITSGVVAGTQEFAQYWVGNRIVNDSPRSRVLFDLDADTMTLVDKRQKSYYTQTFGELRQEADMMAADAQKRLAQLPPEVRPTGAPTAVSVKRTGKSGTIAGYPVEEYAFSGGGVTGFIWATEALQPPAGAKARLAFSRMMGIAAPGVYAAQAMLRIPGVPLRTTVHTGAGAHMFRTTTEVVAVTAEAPGADVLTVPEGFVRVASPFDRMVAAKRGVGHTGAHGPAPTPR